ncbi:heavy metal translocating P-type ATPase [Vibrio sp.]|nr:heavy metal translocating P-type ATPase [Vibrio sp.]
MSDKTCYHCGDLIPHNTNLSVIILEEKREMCCSGCQAVAETIIESGLSSYYQYRTEQADKVDLVPEQLLLYKQYDTPETQAEFISKSNDLSHVTLSLDGVSCAACAWLIEKHLSRLSGVHQIRVNTTTNRAHLSWNNDVILLSDLITAIHNLGYKAAPFETDKQEALYHKKMKQYQYRLGIAGLGTMQVMMLAVALYFEVFSDLEEEFKNYFRWVSLIFATPVLLYSALPFYINAWRSLKARSLGMDVPVSIALIFAYVASVIATIQETGEVFYESISMFTFFLLLGRFLEIRARRKAAAASGNLLKLLPKIATLEDGSQVPVNTLTPGMKVRVNPGESIPADGIILSGQANVEESMLTGESLPVSKHTGSLAYAGTINTDGNFILKINKTKAESMLSTIVRLQEEAQLSKPKIAAIADVISRYFVACILFISAATWLYWHYIEGSSDAFWIMLSVLVATCPCALSLATPTALTCGTSRLSQLGILLKKGHVFETLCKVNHVILDKTGTLTHGDIRISDITTFENYSKSFALKLAASLESHANHPISKSFIVHQDASVQVIDVQNEIGSGLHGLFQGEHIKIGNAEFSDIPIERQQQNAIYLSLNQQHIATFILEDTIRLESLDFIKSLKTKGIKISLLTGDTEQNTQFIREQVSFDHVTTNAKPNDKLTFLNQYKEHDITLMIGDGINDAPILSGAHLSIAMGGGTDVAKSSSDLVLLSDKLDHVLKARELAEFTRKIIRQNLLWALGYNLLILPLAVLGLVAPYIAVIGMSASSIIVVSNSLRLLSKSF